MQLMDGLKKCKSDPKYRSSTLPLESDAKHVLKLLQEHGYTPTLSALAEVKKFLIAVEKWKAMEIPERMIYASQNEERQIWCAFREAVLASSDCKKLSKIMFLKGFGYSKDKETGKRPAKVASAVLRFLWPERWGVVQGKRI